jgi:hypothetical protein
MRDFIEINGNVYWVKIVGMLQQNWALVHSESENVTIYFIHDHVGLYAHDDGSEIFDALDYATQADAEAALVKNGFKQFEDGTSFPPNLAPPKAPFFLGAHPNGKIYSSGQYWRM